MIKSLVMSLPKTLSPLPITTEPGTEPAFVGSNFIDMKIFPPGGIDFGGVKPLAVYMSPTRFSLVTTVLFDPVFVIVT